MRRLALAAVLVVSGVSCLHAAEGSISRKETLEIMQKVADWQLANPSKHPKTDWTQGALYAGMMAMGDLSAVSKYRDAMIATGRANQWKPGPKVYHADDHCVGQMYCELYSLYRDPVMLDQLKERFDYILANPSKGRVEDRIKAEGIPAGIMRWWWCDALFMGPPALIRFYAATGDRKYLDFMIKEWWATSDYLYDKDEHLYFRDNSYFQKKEINGKKVFWSRGNGWVMGGLVRVLQVLPSDHPDRPKFAEQFKEMADKLVTCQQADGLWRSSLLDPESYPNPETSGSGFFCYAIAWGINQGVLDRARFEPVVKKAWAGLTGCVAEDGKLTHVQPIGADPRKFDTQATETYGVGAFLLAVSEMYRMQLLAEVPNTLVSVMNDADKYRTQETVEISMETLKVKLPKVTAENVAVMDSCAGRWILSQVLDENGDGQGDKLIFQSDFLPKQKKSFVVYAGIDRSKLPAPTLKTTARFVPERADDFAWENDRIAFRIYGPALLKQDGPTKMGSGIDIWCKHVREPLVDEMYKGNAYHADNGRGVDCYKVGTGRGCGGVAVWAQDKMWSAKCFDKWRVVTPGPIRAVFELAYGDWDAAGRKVSEVKKVSIDLGSNLNRIESTFKADGDEDLSIAAGLIIHKDGETNDGNGWATVWEQTDGKDNGMLGLGLVLPGGELKKTSDHMLMVSKVKPGQPLVYYVGAGWSKGLDFKDKQSWTTYVKDFSERLRTPLRVEVQ